MIIKKDRIYITSISFGICKFNLINLTPFINFILIINSFLFVFANLVDRANFYQKTNGNSLPLKNPLHIRILKTKFLKRIYLIIRFINIDLLNSTRSFFLKFKKVYGIKTEYQYIAKGKL